MSGAALTAGATLVNIVGQGMQGRGARDEAYRAAAVDDENARLSELAGEQEVAQILRDERMMAGEAIAAMAGNGGALGEGTAADILAESVMNRERAIAEQRIMASQQARNYRQSAEDKRASGRAAVAQAAFNSVGLALEGVASIRAQRLTAAQRRTENAIRLGRAGGGVTSGTRLPAMGPRSRGNG